MVGGHPLGMLIPAFNQSSMTNDRFKWAMIGCAVGLTATALPYAARRAYLWWVGEDDGFKKARADAKKTFEEHVEKAGRKAREVMATLDVMDDQLELAALFDQAVTIAPNLPLHAAYRYSRQVRARMSYPTRTKANLLVAADHIRTLLDENNVRKSVAVNLLPLALEMVFVRDKRELQASLFATLMRGTWREATETAC